MAAVIATCLLSLSPRARQRMHFIPQRLDIAPESLDRLPICNV